MVRIQSPEEFAVAMNICDYCAFSPAFCDGEPEGCFVRLSDRKLKELVGRRREREERDGERL